MTKRYHQIIVLILAVVFVAACTSAPTNPPPTVALLAKVTSTSPTTVLATEDVKTDTNPDTSNGMEANRMNVKIGETVLTATLVQNSSVDALKEALSQGPITVNMRDYGSMEKVGSLGMDLPRNDQQITTEAGDLILL